jgi:Cu(I)/Ag(I) efflux system membrane fusion protein
MKKSTKTTIYIALSTLILGIFIGWLFIGQKSTDEPTALEETTHSKETIWTCSMHPQIRQNEPGQCPLCGMDLIPVKNNSDKDANPMEIKMSPTAMQLANIQTSVVSMQKPIKEIRMNGKVQPDERNVISQSSHIPGRVERLMINFTGEEVKKGQVIAYIYSPELVSAQEELFEALKIKEKEPALYAAVRGKLLNWKLSEKQIDAIIESGKAQDQFPILADVSGVVLLKKVNLGDYLKKGDVLYEVANLTKVWVLFDVYESDLQWVKEGNKVEFNVQSVPSKTYEGTISFIDPVINPTTRVATARVEIANADMKLKPGMFAKGIFKSSLQNQQEALVVPKSAVMWTGERSVVYVKSSSDRGIGFIMREVILGPSLSDSYLIKSGIEVGEEIATNGTFSIDAAAQLAGKPSMMNPEGGAAMTSHDHGSQSKVVKSTGNHSSSLKIGATTKQELSPLLVSYLALKDALVADDFKKAKLKSGEMKMAFSKINMTVFKGEAHGVWMTYSNKLEKALLKATKAKNLEELRESFIGVSDHMIGVFQTVGKINKPLFIEHCPMANNNKGADWISLDREIRNPYFGKSMISCGEVKKEIK